jgi:hypothetical protein
VDLDFTGSDRWHLLVELKLDADFEDTQIERYAEESIVAAVVRDPKAYASRAHESEWVGAASWISLLPRLRSLPVEGQWRQEWLNLLGVMQADGDFAQQRLDGVPEVIAARELLVKSAQEILTSFCDELTKMYGADAQTAITRLRHSKPSGKRGPWAGFNINTPDDGPWLYLEVRNLWSRAPRIRIWHWHWPHRRVRNEVREAYGRVSNPGLVRLLKEGAMFDRAYSSRTPDRSDIPQEFGRRLGELVEAGVFGRDVSYQNKHHRG